MFFTEEIKYEKIQKILPDLTEASLTGYNFVDVKFLEEKNLLLLGAPYIDESGGTDPAGGKGVVYVYSKQGETFVYNQKIVSDDAEGGDRFGCSISFSEDESVLVVGASAEDPSDISNSGAAYVFEYQNGTYVQTQKLQPSNPELSKLFGRQVNISSDGNLITVSSVRGDGERTFRVYVFEKQGTNFVQTQEIVPSEPEEMSQFGSDLQISHDSSFLVIPSRAQDIGTAQNAGKVYIYEKQNGIFIETQVLQEEAPISNYDGFGVSAAISNDDSLIYIGSHKSDKAATDAGAVFVYKKVNNSWTLDYQIFSDDLLNNSFGYELHLSKDDQHLVATAITDSTVDINAGAAYVFSKKNGKMKQVDKILPDKTDEQYKNFGLYGTFISSDGSLVFVNTPVESGLSVEDLGAHYIFKRT